jgi:hypothetical protein
VPCAATVRPPGAASLRRPSSALQPERRAAQGAGCRRAISAARVRQGRTSATPICASTWRAPGFGSQACRGRPLERVHAVLAFHGTDLSGVMARPGATRRFRGDANTRLPAGLKNSRGRAPSDRARTG